MEIPFHPVRTSGARPYFLCDKPSYLLGLRAGPNDARTPHFQLSRDLHNDILSRGSGECARAILAFFMKWDPEKDNDDPRFSGLFDDTSSSFCVFSLDGAPGFAHDDPEIKRLWMEHYVELENGGSQTNMHCLVTNELTSIAEVHSKIKGVSGAQPAGASLVSMNARSFESYGKGSGLNAPIGKESMFKYTTVLNHLLSDPKHHVSIGEDTFVFWADRRGYRGGHLQ